jgi:hypothetical protein
MAKTRRLIAPSPRIYLALADRARELLVQRSDPRCWIESNLWLRGKDQRMVPFRLWPAQAHWYRRRSGCDVILKARQLGFTSLICALYLADTVLRPNTISVMVAHDLDSVERIFQIVRLFWERLPEEEKRRLGEPRYLNKRELYWPSLNSRFWVGTAGSAASGRGHTINNLHCSELAYWSNLEKVLAGLTEGVPPGGRIVIESTANGTGNPFHDLWVEAKQEESAYHPHFYPWWWDQGYRLPGPPLRDLTEEEQQLKETRGLNEDQLRWRRAKMRALRDRFPQEYPEDEVTCFLASGRCVFDTTVLSAIHQRIALESPPEKVSALVRDGKTVSIAPAHLLVWRRPEPQREYVIGADVGGGGASGDAAAAFVLDYITGEQVAELQGRVTPDRFAHLLDALGRYYNQAELAVERNNHGHSTLNTLLHTCEYPNLYRHRDYTELHWHTGAAGWPTDAKTKPLMIDGLAAAIVEGTITIRSSALIDECLTYVVTDSGSTEAQPGKHDDRVIAAAIAWQVRKRPTPVPNIRML